MVTEKGLSPFILILLRAPVEKISSNEKPSLKKKKNIRKTKTKAKTKNVF